jgi:hypothetical protein
MGAAAAPMEVAAMAANSGLREILGEVRMR